MSNVTLKQAGKKWKGIWLTPDKKPPRLLKSATRHPPFS